MTQFLQQYNYSDDIEVSKINYQFLNRFEIFLDKTFNNDMNTIHGEIKRLKAVINMGIKLEWVTNNPVKNYVRKTKAPNRGALN